MNNAAPDLAAPKNESGFPFALRRYPKKPRKIPIKNPRHEYPIRIFLCCSFVFTVASMSLLELDWGKIASRIPRLRHVFWEMLQFSGERFSITLLTLGETVAVSILALIYGLMLGLAAGALSARNITPWKPLSVVLKCVYAFMRAVPTPVWVLLVLASMGFGMASGVVGLGFHCFAFFGKVFSQLFEEVPDETIEAVKSSGANRIQIFFNAVLPASLSGILAWTALRFETNYVEASILGMVGAGGVGYTILAAMSGYKFGRAGLAVAVVFAFALATELLTTHIKRKVKI